MLRKLNIEIKALLKGALDHVLQHSPCKPRIYVAHAYLGEYQKNEACLSLMEAK